MSRPLAWTYRPNRVRRDVNFFESYISSPVEGTRPAAGWGTQITPAQNAQNGTWAQLIAPASVTHDAYEIRVVINAGSSSTAARDMLVSIGVDPAGGTSYAVLIPNLLTPAAIAYVSGLGIVYTFPVRIAAGSSIAARASVNNGTVGVVRVACRLACQPTRPDLLWTGSIVESFGVDTANSCGTAVTPGGAAEGDYVQLGTALTETIRFWQLGIGANNGTMENALLHGDLALGDASTKRQVIVNAAAYSTTAEQISAVYEGHHGRGVAGELVYGRLQNSGTSNFYSMAAYGVRD